MALDDDDEDPEAAMRAYMEKTKINKDKGGPRRTLVERASDNTQGGADAFKQSERIIKSTQAMTDGLKLKRKTAAAEMEADDSDGGSGGALAVRALLEREISDGVHRCSTVEEEGELRAGKAMAVADALVKQGIVINRMCPRPRSDEQTQRHSLYCEHGTYSDLGSGALRSSSA